MHIEVVNKRNEEGLDVVGGIPREYIGRPSPLGNPFVIGRDGDRRTVIKLYDNWLTEQIATFTCHGVESPAVKELNRLWTVCIQNEGLKLVCWCSPQACHGDVIKYYLDHANEKMNAHFNRQIKVNLDG